MCENHLLYMETATSRLNILHESALFCPVIGCLIAPNTRLNQGAVKVHNNSCSFTLFCNYKSSAFFHAYAIKSRSRCLVHILPTFKPYNIHPLYYIVNHLIDINFYYTKATQCHHLARRSCSYLRTTMATSLMLLRSVCRPEKNRANELEENQVSFNTTIPIEKL
jgi:hypothetical protein